MSRRYLQEAIQRCQHHRHGQVVRVNEVQGLGHCNEDLIVHTVGNALLFHPFRHRERITLFDVFLAEQNGRDEPNAELNFLRTG